MRLGHGSLAHQEVLDQFRASYGVSSWITRALQSLLLCIVL